MTLNEWGCKVTEWRSIRIYAYTAKKEKWKPYKKKENSIFKIIMRADLYWKD